MKTNQPISDQILESAAAEALGANTPADSAAHQQQVAASEAARRTESDLRETVAKLAAASPYMAPPEALRGRILQATAPQTFRMEDYRKATHDSGRFYRWGFAAAVLFLAAGAWYNMAIQKQLTIANNQKQFLQQELNGRNVAIHGLINPKVDQIAVHQDNKLAAKAFVNDENKTAVVVVPQGAIPPDKTINKITLTRNGKTVVYDAVAVTVPRSDFPDAPALMPTMNVQNVEPESTRTVYKAGLLQGN
jgi:hypothetical protein